MKDFGNSYYGDNVPCDVSAPHKKWVTHSCSDCEYTWEVEMWWELGRLYYSDEDAERVCQVCGSEGDMR